MIGRTWKSGDGRSRAVLMVEGLTTSAPDQGSGQDPGIGPWQHDEIDDLTSSLAPRALERAGVADHIQQQDPGDSSGEAIPVPIPNTAVKLSSAEDTERAAFRENRSSPGFLRFRAVRCPRTRAGRTRPPGILFTNDQPTRFGRRAFARAGPAADP